MADISAVKVWTNEQFTPTDINAEFTNVYTNHVSKSTAQTVSGRKTYSGGIILDELVSVAAAGSGDIKLTEFRWDPASGTATDADGMYIDWMSDDDGGNDTIYGRQHLEFVDTGASSEDSEWHFHVQIAATLTDVVTLAGTALSPTTTDGVALGTSSLNWSDLFLDSGAVINFDSGDVTLTHSANILTVGGGDLHVANGQGVVIGHTAQVTAGAAWEAQVLGTGVADSGLMLGRWSADAFGPFLAFTKSRNATIGSSTVLQDGDDLATINFYADDGADFESIAAQIMVEIDGTPGSNDVPGRIVLKTTADGAATATERMRIDSSGMVGIGDTANANMTVGLTINQGANDDLAFCVKSSDVSTGITTATLARDVEADDYFTLHKIDATTGGVQMQVLAENTNANAFLMEVYQGGPATTDTSSSLGAYNIFVSQHDGSNGLSDMAANSNACAWGEITSAGARTTRMLLKADDGELHLGNTTLVALDFEDDNQLVRAMQRESAVPGTIIETEHDNPFYSYEKLREHGLAGEKDEDGFFLMPLQTRLHAHEGAMWQTYCAVKDMREDVLELRQAVDERDSRIAALETQIQGLLN